MMSNYFWQYIADILSQIFDVTQSESSALEYGIRELHGHK